MGRGRRVLEPYIALRAEHVRYCKFCEAYIPLVLLLRTFSRKKLGFLSTVVLVVSTVDGLQTN